MGTLKRTKKDLIDILPIGIKLIGNNSRNTPEKKGYFKAINDGTIHYNKDYNVNFSESEGKVLIYFYINYSENGIFAEVRQDGDTRTVYNGIIPNKEFFINLLNNIR